MQVLGVHITPYHIYAVSLRTADAQPIVVKQTALPLSLELNEEQRKAELVLKLKELVKEYPQHEFVFTVPQTQVSIHDLKFPFTEKFKINKALPFEIEDKIPFSDMVYSSKICYRSNTGSSVLSFVSSKSWMTEFLELIKSAGIQTSILVPESSALSNLFEDWKASPPKLSPPVSGTQLKLYLSYNQSIALVLSSDNRVLLIHNLNWGFQSCIQSISAKYRRDLNKALTYFFENAILTHDDMEAVVPLSKIIKESFSSLSHHMRLLLIYLKGAGHASIEDITILGPGAMIQNLSYHLYKAVHTPVHKMEDEEKFSIPSSDYLISLGTAIEAFKKPKNPPINLMPHMQEERIKITKHKLTLIKSISAAVIIFFAYIGVRNWKASELTLEMNQIFSNYARRVAGLKTRSISIKNVEKFLKQKKYNQDTSKAFQSLNQIPSVLDTLKQFSFSLDASSTWNMEITQLEIKDRQVDIQGTVTEQYFESLVQHLKTLTPDGKVEQKKVPVAEKKEIIQKETPQEFIPEPEESLETQIDELSEALAEENPSDENELLSEESNTPPQEPPKPVKHFYFTLTLKS
ncbi:MAG: type II secretion system protein GspL [Bdellovibrionales bacterium]|nr:type II secretion system protein GspL [Bdellovibrionales bacterium]